MYMPDPKHLERLGDQIASVDRQVRMLHSKVDNLLHRRSLDDLLHMHRARFVAAWRQKIPSQLQRHKTQPQAVSFIFHARSFVVTVCAFCHSPFQTEAELIAHLVGMFLCVCVCAISVERCFFVFMFLFVPRIGCQEARGYRSRKRAQTPSFLVCVKKLFQTRLLFPQHPAVSHYRALPPQ